MPENGDYCIGLSVQSFKNFTCAWMGSVYDCYILLSGSHNKPFKLFQLLSPLGVAIVESDIENGPINIDQHKVI